jgi:hypothetical protein
MHIETGGAAKENILMENSILQHTEQHAIPGGKVIYLKAYCAKQESKAAEKALITTSKRKFNPLLFLWNWAHNFMSTVAHMLH